MIKAIIFDCFGVVLGDALSELCAELELRDHEAAAQVRALIHAANKGIIDPNESTTQAAALLGLTIDQYRTRINQGETRNQKLLDYIQLLRKDYKTAMLSNITPQGIERRFPDNELASYFDEVVISGAIGFAKPEPEAYLITTERLGVAPSDCVFTDDRPDYVAAAQQVGMQALLYESFPQFQAALTEVLNEV